MRRVKMVIVFLLGSLFIFSCGLVDRLEDQANKAFDSVVNEFDPVMVSDDESKEKSNYNTITSNISDKPSGLADIQKKKYCYGNIEMTIPSDWNFSDKDGDVFCVLGDDFISISSIIQKNIITKEEFISLVSNDVTGQNIIREFTIDDNLLVCEIQFPSEINNINYTCTAALLKVEDRLYFICLFERADDNSEYHEIFDDIIDSLSIIEEIDKDEKTSIKQFGDIELKIPDNFEMKDSSNDTLNFSYYDSEFRFARFTCEEEFSQKLADYYLGLIFQGYGYTFKGTDKTDEGKEFYIFELNIDSPKKYFANAICFKYNNNCYILLMLESEVNRNRDTKLFENICKSVHLLGNYDLEDYEPTKVCDSFNEISFEISTQWEIDKVTDLQKIYIKKNSASIILLYAENTTIYSSDWIENEIKHSMGIGEVTIIYSERKKLNNCGINAYDIVGKCYYSGENIYLREIAFNFGKDAYLVTYLAKEKLAENEEFDEIINSINLQNPLPATELTVLPEPTVIFEPTATPKPTVMPEPTATPKPTVTPEPTATPKPTVTPEPTATPRPTATPKPTVTPKPTATPKPTKQKEVTVYVSNKGKIHKNPSCSGMKYYTPMSFSDAVSHGYEFCKKCY